MGKRKIIDLSEVTTDDYINATKIQKKKICKYLITLILLDFKQNEIDLTDEDEVLADLNSIIDFTIKQYEIIEDYERCQILIDIKNMLNE